MKKFYKKLISLLLVAIMSVSACLLAACSETPEDNSADNTSISAGESNSGSQAASNSGEQGGDTSSDTPEVIPEYRLDVEDRSDYTVENIGNVYLDASVYDVVKTIKTDGAIGALSLLDGFKVGDLYNSLMTMVAAQGETGLSFDPQFFLFKRGIDGNWYNFYDANIHPVLNKLLDYDLDGKGELGLTLAQLETYEDTTLLYLFKWSLTNSKVVIDGKEYDKGSDSVNRLIERMIDGIYKNAKDTVIGATLSATVANVAKMIQGEKDGFVNTYGSMTLEQLTGRELPAPYAQMTVAKVIDLAFARSAEDVLAVIGEYKVGDLAIGAELPEGFDEMTIAELYGKYAALLDENGNLSAQKIVEKYGELTLGELALGIGVYEQLPEYIANMSVADVYDFAQLLVQMSDEENGEEVFLAAFGKNTLGALVAMTGEQLPEELSALSEVTVEQAYNFVKSLTIFGETGDAAMFLELYGKATLGEAGRLFGFTVDEEMASLTFEELLAPVFEIADALAKGDEEVIGKYFGKTLIVDMLNIDDPDLIEAFGEMTIADVIVAALAEAEKINETGFENYVTDLAGKAWNAVKDVTVEQIAQMLGFELTEELSANADMTIEEIVEAVKAKLAKEQETSERQPAEEDEPGNDEGQPEVQPEGQAEEQLSPEEIKAAIKDVLEDIIIISKQEAVEGGEEGEYKTVEFTAFDLAKLVGDLVEGVIASQEKGASVTKAYNAVKAFLAENDETILYWLAAMDEYAENEGKDEIIEVAGAQEEDGEDKPEEHEEYQPSYTERYELVKELIDKAYDIYLEFREMTVKELLVELGYEKYTEIPESDNERLGAIAAFAKKVFAYKTIEVYENVDAIAEEAAELLMALTPADILGMANVEFKLPETGKEHIDALFALVKKYLGYNFNDFMTEYENIEQEVLGAVLAFTINDALYFAAPQVTMATLFIGDLIEKYGDVPASEFIGYDGEQWQAVLEDVKTEGIKTFRQLASLAAVSYGFGNENVMNFVLSLVDAAFAEDEESNELALETLKKITVKDAIECAQKVSFDVASLIQYLGEKFKGGGKTPDHGNSLDVAGNTFGFDYVSVQGDNPPLDEDFIMSLKERYENDVIEFDDEGDFFWYVSAENVTLTGYYKQDEENLTLYANGQFDDMGEYEQFDEPIEYRFIVTNSEMVLVVVDDTYEENGKTYQYSISVCFYIYVEQSFEYGSFEFSYHYVDGFSPFDDEALEQLNLSAYGTIISLNEDKTVSWYDPVENVTKVGIFEIEDKDLTVYLVGEYDDAFNYTEYTEKTVYSGKIVDSVFELVIKTGYVEQDGEKQEYQLIAHFSQHFEQPKPVIVDGNTFICNGSGYSGEFDDEFYDNVIKQYVASSLVFGDANDVTLYDSEKQVIWTGVYTQEDEKLTVVVKTDEGEQIYSMSVYAYYIDWIVFEEETDDYFRYIEITYSLYE